MTTPHRTQSSAFLRALLCLCTLAQLVPLAAFARTMHGRGEHELLGLTALSSALALLGAWAAWGRRAWAGWAVLISASWTATIGLWSVSAEQNPRGWWVFALASGVILLGLLAPAPRLQRIAPSVRVFCAAVVTLTRYVAFWGLLFPLGLSIALPGFAQGFNDALPFVPEIPPLHARFIGALYLGATVICVWHVFARSWAVGRLLQALIFLWTFILLLVSLRHLDAFDWTKSSVWHWFVAYLAFPALSLWIYLRIEPEPEPGPDAVYEPLPRWGRLWLYAQGVGLLALALLGTFAVEVLIRVWPWKLGELLGHIYSAPFAAFGIGSCLAAAARGARRRAVVPFCAATFAMAAGSLAASLLHRDKFEAEAPSTWVWFAVLVLVALASLALLAHVFMLSRSAAERAPSTRILPGVAQP